MTSPSAEDWEDSFPEDTDGARRLQDADETSGLRPALANIFVNRTTEADGCVYKYTCEIQEFDFVYVTPEIAEPIEEKPS